jgi:CRISPR/Cas system-associated exonuclease Cas4 (RecB family)
MGIISYLVDFFQRLPVAERPRYLLLLPTKNLIEQFQYRLTKACGTTLLPYTYTLSTFIQDYGQVYTRPISNATRRAIMHRAISSKKFTHFASGSEATLFSLWEDFVFTGRIAADDELSSGKFLEETLSCLAPTINRSATYRQFMESYLEEFNDIFRTYLELLAKLSLEDPLLISRRQITNTIRYLPEIANRFQLMVADLYDAPPIQLQLLETLARLGATFIFSGYHFSERRRWSELIKRLPPEQVTWCSPPAKEILRRAAAPEPQKLPPLPVTESIAARVFPSVAAECRYIIHQALALVCDGIPADEIAIVVTDQRHYREILYCLIHALPASRMPLDIFSFNLKRQIGQSALATFIETLIRLAGGAPLSTQLLLEVIESPFFSHFFLLPVAVPAGRLGRNGNTSESDNPVSEKNESAEKAILTNLRQELTDQVITSTETLKIMAKRSSDPGVQQGIKALIAAGRYFPTHALLSNYLKIIAGLIEQSTGIIGDLYENTVRDHLAAVVEELRQLELDISFQPASFHAFFLAAITSEETGLNYDYLSGIQILDPRDAKGIAAKALFLTGNSSGSFLGQEHQNRCFSPGQQELLGLITPDRQEILQRFTVYSLINNCGKVWCTRALEIEGRTREANIFFKELLWAGMEPLMPMVDIVWADQKTEKKPAGENQAEEALLPIKKLPQRLSGHQATYLLQCPARYLFEALRIQAPAIREERLDPLGEGAILHQVAEILGKSLPKPKDKREILDKIAEISRQLEITWEERMLFSFLDHSGCWERLADFLLEDNCESLAVEEWIAADLEPVTGLRIQGVGKIDRRDRGAAGERLVDYKRSTIPSKKAINSFADVQLLFYALLKALNGEKVDTIAYYSIRQRQRNCSEAEVEPLIATFSDILRQQLHGILDSGGYRKIIARHCDRCPYQEICLDESQLRSING